MSAIEKLKSGFKDFQAGQFKENQAIYEDLVDKGQKPDVAFIACSDSRVDPAIVMQADPGDLFVIRNVANLVPPYETDGNYHGTSAALEYAVQNLNVGHIVVLGHAHCGGIDALVNPPKTGTEGNFFVPAWTSIVENAYLRVMATMPNATAKEKAHACEQGAVLVSLENLMTFPCIRKNVKEGKLRLHGWYVDIRAGQLSTYDAASQKFEILAP